MQVYEGVPILAAWQAQPLAGEAVEAAVRADLACRGQVTRGEGGDPEPLDPELLTPQLVADVALRCCFVTSLNRGRQLTELTSDPAEAKEGLSTWLSKDAAPTVIVPCGGDKLLQVNLVDCSVCLIKRHRRWMGSQERQVQSYCGRWTRIGCLLLASYLMQLLPVPLTAGQSRRLSQGVHHQKSFFAGLHWQSRWC